MYLSGREYQKCSPACASTQTDNHLWSHYLSSIQICQSKLCFICREYQKCISDTDWSAPWVYPENSVIVGLYNVFNLFYSFKESNTSNCFSRGFHTSISKETYSNLCISRGGGSLWVRLKFAVWKIVTYSILTTLQDLCTFCLRNFFTSEQPQRYNLWSCQKVCNGLHTYQTIEFLTAG